MTLELRLRAEAELDLADAALWYEGQCPGLGHQLLDEVLTVFSSISKMALCAEALFQIARTQVCRPLTVIKQQGIG